MQFLCIVMGSRQRRSHLAGIEGPGQVLGSRYVFGVHLRVGGGTSETRELPNMAHMGLCEGCL